MKTLNTLDDLFWDQVRDMYNAENQLIKALPKMAKQAGDEGLERAILSHLEQTKTHTQRLEQVFQEAGKGARGQKCEAMEGLIQEATETLERDAEQAVLDAAIICCAQKVEHYEIATYGTLASWAELLGHSTAVRLLKQTLQEEKEADQTLTDISEKFINRAAAQTEIESVRFEAEDDSNGKARKPKKGDMQEVRVARNSRSTR